MADSFSLSATDWRLLREAIDLLGQSTIIINDETLTYTQFYERFVDQPHADRLIEQLDVTSDPISDCPALQAEIARRIVADFASLSNLNTTNAEKKLLLSFCLYWWSAFARGYAFEIAIFRDLALSGISFVPHDYRARDERRSFCDFFIFGFAADVKLSTYFLSEGRNDSATCDIYITRLYDTPKRLWIDIVVLSEQAWQAIDGETTPIALDQVAALLPEEACQLTDAPRWVVIDYDRWKTMMLSNQQISGGTTP